MVSSSAAFPLDVGAAFSGGTVIPAHLLALDSKRRFDARRQRALTRYYLDSGVGGLAVGVHSTQFAIRESGLYRRVLECAAATAAEFGRANTVLIAGAVGRTAQARSETQLAREFGYHAVLLGLSAFHGASDDELIEHSAAVAREMPLVGFYLQPAVGGIVLSESFWKRFAQIDNVIGIKIAPFDRYRTLDVVRGVVAARAEERVTLYTGNDDHVVLDLLAPFAVKRDGEDVVVRIRGGLLGHWSVWTRGAVQLFERIREAVVQGTGDPDLLALDSRVTDCNAAFFDAHNDFRGAIAGCHEVLRRQGLFEGIWCLDENETLSPGQSERIARVMREHADLGDDAFVAANLDRWLS